MPLEGSEVRSEFCEHVVDSIMPDFLELFHGEINTDTAKNLTVPAYFLGWFSRCGNNTGTSLSGCA
jgi:hypothetical protein